MRVMTRGAVRVGASGKPRELYSYSYLSTLLIHKAADPKISNSNTGWYSTSILETRDLQRA